MHGLDQIVAMNNIAARQLAAKKGIKLDEAHRQVGNFKKQAKRHQAVKQLLAASGR